MFIFLTILVFCGTFVGKSCFAPSSLNYKSGIKELKMLSKVKTPKNVLTKKQESFLQLVSGIQTMSWKLVARVFSTEYFSLLIINSGEVSNL